MGIVNKNGIDTLIGAIGADLEELTGVTGSGNNIGLDTIATNIVTTGAASGALADGVKGQLKIIALKTDGGTYTLTPANFANGTTLAFADVNDTAMLLFDGTNWVSIGTTTATIA